MVGLQMLITKYSPRKVTTLKTSLLYYHLKTTATAGSFLFETSHFSNKCNVPAYNKNVLTLHNIFQPFIQLCPLLPICLLLSILVSNKTCSFLSTMIKDNSYFERPSKSASTLNLGHCQLAWCMFRSKLQTISWITKSQILLFCHKNS